jgi:hypothetical protein
MPALFCTLNTVHEEINVILLYALLKELPQNFPSFFSGDCTLRALIKTYNLVQ